MQVLICKIFGHKLGAWETNLNVIKFGRWTTLFFYKCRRCGCTITKEHVTDERHG